MMKKVSVKEFKEIATDSAKTKALAYLSKIYEGSCLQAFPPAVGIPAEHALSDIHSETIGQGWKCKTCRKTEEDYRKEDYATALRMNRLMLPAWMRLKDGKKTSVSYFRADARVIDPPRKPTAEDFRKFARVFWLYAIDLSNR